MNERLDKYCEIALEVLLFIFVITVSLIFDRRLGIVFSLTKTTFIRFIGLLVLSVLATKYFVGGRFSFKRSPFDFHVLTYLICVAAATITSINVYVSFSGAYGRYEGFSTILLFIMAFFLSTNFLTDTAKRWKMGITILVCSAVMGLYGIIQRMGIDPYMWGGVVTNERVIATIGQPNFLAGYFIMAFMIGFSFLLRPEINQQSIDAPKEKIKINKFKQQAVKQKSLFQNLIEFTMEQSPFVLHYFFILGFFVFMISAQGLDSAKNVFAWYAAFFFFIFSVLIFVYQFFSSKRIIQDSLVIISIVLTYIGLLFTQSRGGLIGFLAAFSLLVFLLPKNTFFENWKKLAVLAAILVIISGAVFLQNDISPLSRLAGEVKVDNTQQSESMKFSGAAGSRLETWKSAFGMVSDRPIFGIGPEVMKMVFPRYETEMFRFYEAFHVKQDRCHNETLDVSVTKGILSLFVYVWLLGSIFFFAIKTAKNSDIDDKLLIIGFFVAAVAYLYQNQFSFGVVAITSPFWVLLGCIAGYGVKNIAIKQEKEFNPKWMICSIAFLFIAFAMYLSTFQYNNDICFKSGKMFLDSGNLDASISEFNKGIEIAPYEGNPYTHLGIAYLNMAANSKDQKLWLDKCLNVFTAGTLVDPYNADNFYLRAKTYMGLSAQGNNLDKNIVDDSNITLKIDPYYAEAYQNLAIICEKQGRPLDAANMYEKAFLINPTMIVWLKEIERIYAKYNLPNILAVYDDVIKRYPDREEIQSNMANIYSEKGVTDRAEKIFEEILKKNKNSLAAINGIASLLIKKGAIDEAFLKYQDALLIDPRNVGTHNGLGFIYYKKGKIKEAREEFGIVLIYDSNNDYAKRMLQIVK